MKCKNCNCSECNPPPKPSATGLISHTKGTPFEFSRGELLVYPNEEDGKYKFVLTGWADVKDMVIWNLPTIAPAKIDNDGKSTPGLGCPHVEG